MSTFTLLRKSNQNQNNEISMCIQGLHGSSKFHSSLYSKKALKQNHDTLKMSKVISKFISMYVQGLHASQTY